MKKIILIDAFGLNGGAEKVMINTYRALKKSFSPICMMPDSSGHHSKIDSGDFLGFNSTFDLIRKVVKASPEIIILNNKLALKYLIPLKIICPKLKVIYHSHAYFRNRFEQFIYKLLFLKLLDKVICVSESLKKNHIDNHEDKKHHVIYNGFNFSYPEIKKKKDGKINVFFWAQFREWKGHLFLLDVISEINNNSVQFHFLANIQDKESEMLYSKINRTIKNNKLSKKIKFHLNIENHLSFINKNADIALSCSQVADPLPTIIIESLSMGIPILATNTGGCREILNCFPSLLSGLNKDQFVMSLKKLLNNYSDYDSNVLKSHYNEKFNESLFNKKIISLVNSI